MDSFNQCKRHHWWHRSRGKSCCVASWHVGASSRRRWRIWCRGSARRGEWRAGHRGRRILSRWSSWPRRRTGRTWRGRRRRRSRWRRQCRVMSTPECWSRRRRGRGPGYPSSPGPATRWWSPLLPCPANRAEEVGCGYTSEIANRS